MDDSTLYHSSPGQRQHNNSGNTIRRSQECHQAPTDITLIQSAIDPQLDSLNLLRPFNVIGNQQSLPIERSLSELLDQNLEEHFDLNIGFHPQFMDSTDPLHSSELPEDQTSKMSQPDESKSVKKEQEEAAGEEVAHSRNAQAFESLREDAGPAVNAIDLQGAERPRQAIIDSAPRGDRLQALWGSLPSLNLTEALIMDRARQPITNNTAASNMDQTFRDHMQATQNLYPLLQLAIAHSKGLPSNSDHWTQEMLDDIKYTQVALHIKARVEICWAFKVSRPPFRSTSWPSDQLRLMLDILQLARDQVVPRSRQDSMTVTYLKLSVMQWQLDVIQRWISGLRQPDNTANLGGDNDNDDHQHRPGHKRSRSQGYVVETPSKRRPGRPAGATNKSRTQQEHDVFEAVVQRQRNPTATTAQALASTRTSTHFPLDRPYDQVVLPTFRGSIKTAQPSPYLPSVQQPQAVPLMDQRAPSFLGKRWLNPQGQRHAEAQSQYQQPQSASVPRNTTSRHQQAYPTPPFPNRSQPRADPATLFPNIRPESWALQQSAGRYPMASEGQGFLGQQDQQLATHQQFDIQQQTAQMPYFRRFSSFGTPRNDLPEVPTTWLPPVSAAQQNNYGIEGRAPHIAFTSNHNTHFTGRAQGRNIDGAQNLNLNNTSGFVNHGWNPNAERPSDMPTNLAETRYNSNDWPDEEEDDEQGGLSRGEQGTDEAQGTGTGEGRRRRKTE